MGIKQETTFSFGVAVASYIPSGLIQTFGKGGSKSEHPFTELLKGTPAQIFNDILA